MKTIKICRTMMLLLSAAAFLCSCDTGQLDAGIEDLLDKNQTDSTSNNNVSTYPLVEAELRVL